MIKIEYSFENGEESKARQLIDSAKWHLLVKNLCGHLLERGVDDKLSFMEQSVYLEIRDKIIKQIEKEGLVL